jgi:hypothetical protein
MAAMKTIVWKSINFTNSFRMDFLISWSTLYLLNLHKGSPDRAEGYPGFQGLRESDA